MKWQPEMGAWPAFWLIPVQAAQHSGPSESGEIDIFEGQGDEPHTFFGTIHRWNGSHELASSSPHNRFPPPAPTNFADYHTYGLLWTPGQVSWYFDGAPLHTERTYDVFDRQDYCIVLSMQEGADWRAGDLTGVTAQSLTLTIDWVHVWQK
jgi:beta-glucanase (GH16 family)